MNTLYVFDFDDTLVHSHSTIIVVHADGTESELTSAEYATYKEQPGDVMDYSDFDKNPEQAARIDQVFTELEQALSSAGAANVVVLTARSNTTPVVEFLADQGLSGVQVVGTGSTNPMDKAKYVLDRVLNDEYDEVHVYEDSAKNIRTIKRVVGKLGVQLFTNRVTTTGGKTVVVPESANRKLSKR